MIEREKTDAAAGPQTKTSNRILSHLSVDDFRLLKPYLAFVELPLRRELEAPNKPIHHVYFIESGFASIAARRPTYSVDVALIGREGITGLAIIMGARTSPNSTYMTLAGRGLRIPADELQRAMERSATLRQTLLLYGHAFIVQTTQTAMANWGKVDERIARWLLMAHDRVDGDDLKVTHDALALTLAVRRASVTVTLDLWEEKSIIALKRGIISIRDRASLEKTSGGSYGQSEAEFQRLFG